MLVPLFLVLTAAPSSPADAPARVAGLALTSGRPYARLAELTDLVGPRLAGSPGDAAAVRWAVNALKADGLTVWTEKVMVPHWVRGVERARLTLPVRPQERPLAITALGGSPGTPDGGVEAEVVEVRSFDELDALGDRVEGKLVLFQHDMGPGMSGYGQNARLRSRGPAEAAKRGAAGALVRSLATASLNSPHTGATSFPADVTPIPAAAVSVEDALLLHRLLERGPVRVHLELGCGLGTPGEVESANVVAEVKGRERPGEVVLIGAHLDSWDLSDGAVDDGAGVVMVMEALRAIARVGPPRRTVRAVLFANEENGLRGGVEYARRHAADRHVAALETDSGAGRPLGFSVGAGDGGVALLSRLMSPLAPLGVTRVEPGGGGADISPLRYQQVPVLGLTVDTTHYFDWHHSAADTLDKVDPRELAMGAASVAVLAWQLAESTEVLPRPPAPTEPPWWAGERSPR